MTQADSPAAKDSSPPATSNNINGDVYIADGDYIKDIEVNDLRNRYTLTKGSTQKMVNILVAPYPLILSGPHHVVPSIARQLQWFRTLFLPSHVLCGGMSSLLSAY